MVAQGIPDGVVGDALAVEPGQQILPFAVPIGIGLAHRPVDLLGQQVPASVIGVFDGVPSAVLLLDQLVPLIVGIGHLQRPVFADGPDVSKAVVGIAVGVPRSADAFQQRGGVVPRTVYIGIFRQRAAHALNLFHRRPVQGIIGIKILRRN